MSDILISVENLNKVYDRTDGKKVYAVNDVSLELKKGLAYGLVGESGCGKSTLGQMLVKLLNPSSGRILFDNKELKSLSGKEEKTFRKKAQIIFQNPYDSLNPKMKIKDIIEEPLLIHRIGNTKEDREKLSDEIRKMCGLESSVMNKYPSELSGGQRQRVCIASSLILNPEFLVLDEAVSSLDVLIQAQILNILKSMQKVLGLTYLFISHNLNAVSYLSDVIFVMYMGRIVESGPVNELLENPKHPYTKALFSAAYNLNQKEENRIILHGDLPNPTVQKPGCPFEARCPFAEEKCRNKNPVLERTGESEDHYCACWKK